MKLAACFLTLLPGFAVAASWTSPGFPAFSEQGTGTFVSHAQLPKGTRPLTLNFDQQCWQPADAIKLNQMLSLQPCSNTPPQWRLFRDGKYTLQIDTRSGTPTLMISIQNAAEPVANLVREGPKWDGLPLALDVSATFPEGAAVRDYYSQQMAIVKNGQIMLQPAATSNGLLLLERAETDTSAPFDWHNATVYFVLTDRFENGDPSNDQSYGRHKDGMAEIGTFHGGDLRGLTWRKRRAIELLHRVGIKDHKDAMRSFPYELTEGECQKVMIAIALANQPRLLIADEPTNSMEPTTQAQIFRLLTRLNQNSNTTNKTNTCNC